MIHNILNKDKTHVLCFLPVYQNSSRREKYYCWLKHCYQLRTGWLDVYSYLCLYFLWSNLSVKKVCYVWLVATVPAGRSRTVGLLRTRRQAHSIRPSSTSASIRPSSRTWEPASKCCLNVIAGHRLGIEWGFFEADVAKSLRSWTACKEWTPNGPQAELLNPYLVQNSNYLV